MVHTPKFEKGLYAITPEHEGSAEDLADAVRSVLRGGATLVQYRTKSAIDRLDEAKRVLAECRAFGVPLIVNDDVELAVAIGADGVHLGRYDTPLNLARARLGPKAIVGVSCYDSLALALDAERQGADYVAFGRFFPSKTKPNAPSAHLETLRAAKVRLTVPIVAIGGITSENGATLIEAGADLLAVIDGIFGASDRANAAQAFQRLFARTVQDLIPVKCVR